MKRFISLLCISMVLVACDNQPATGDSTSLNNSTSKTKIPVQAIDFTLPDLAGKPQKLSEYLKKGPVMLVFFTTWCPYCKKEIPTLKQVSREYGPKGLQLVAINAGLVDNLDNAKHYALQYRLPYVVLYDADGITSGQYGVRTVPKILYIQQDGKVVHTSRKVRTQAIVSLMDEQ